MACWLAYGAATAQLTSKPLGQNLSFEPQLHYAIEAFACLSQSAEKPAPATY